MCLYPMEQHLFLTAQLYFGLCSGHCACTKIKRANTTETSSHRSALNQEGEVACLTVPKHKWNEARNLLSFLTLHIIKHFGNIPRNKSYRESVTKRCCCSIQFQVRRFDTRNQGDDNWMKKKYQMKLKCIRGYFTTLPSFQSTTLASHKKQK